MLKKNEGLNFKKRKIEKKKKAIHNYKLLKEYRKMKIQVR